MVGEIPSGLLADIQAALANVRSLEMRIFLVEEYMDNIDQNKWKTAACIDNILPAIAPDVLKNIQVTFRCTSTSCLQRLAQDPDTASLFTSLQQNLLKVSPKSVQFTLTTYTRRRAPCAMSSLSFFEAIIKETFPLLWNLNLINTIVQDPECESYIPGLVIASEASIPIRRTRSALARDKHEQI